MHEEKRDNRANKQWMPDIRPNTDPVWDDQHCHRTVSSDLDEIPFQPNLKRSTLRTIRLCFIPMCLASP